MGGGERHVLSLLRGFRGRPVEMSLAVFTEGPLSKAARDLGVEVHVLPKRFRGDPGPLVDLERLIRARGMDVVHTHLISGNSYGRLAGRMGGAKVVSTLHHSAKEAMGPTLSPRMQAAFFRFDIWMTAFCDRVVTPSEDLRQQLVRAGVRESRLVTIPNGISLDEVRVSEKDAQACRAELGALPGTKVVGMAGRLVDLKNFDLLLRAGREILAAGVPARIVVIGDGPDRTRLEALARQLGIAEAAVFTGFREDVLRVVAALDVFVLCSRSETFPLALVEAMALGKPVVAARVGGVPEIVDHEANGLLFASEDEAALVQALRRLLADDEARQRLGAEARRKVASSFTEEIMAERLLGLYRELAGG